MMWTKTGALFIRLLGTHRDEPQISYIYHKMQIGPRRNRWKAAKRWESTFVQDKYCMIQFFCGVWHHTCLCFGTGQILCVVQYAPPHNMRMRGIMVHNRDGEGEERKIKQTGNQRKKKIPVLFAREKCVHVCRLCVHIVAYYRIFPLGILHSLSIISSLVKRMFFHIYLTERSVCCLFFSLTIEFENWWGIQLLCLCLVHTHRNLARYFHPKVPLKLFCIAEKNFIYPKFYSRTK